MSIANALKNASKDTIRLNPHLGLLPGEKTKLAVNVRARRGIRKAMNMTESEYARILEAMKQRGEILRYEFEGITLRWQGIKYTPDFLVFHCQTIECPSPTESTIFQHIKLIEIKGPFIKGKYERAIERFRHARTYWPEFQFELHQKTRQGWKQIY